MSLWAWVRGLQLYWVAWTGFLPPWPPWAPEPLSTPFRFFTPNPCLRRRFFEVAITVWRRATVSGSEIKEIFWVLCSSGSSKLPPQLGHLSSRSLLTICHRLYVDRDQFLHTPLLSTGWFSGKAFPRLSHSCIRFRFLCKKLKKHWWPACCRSRTMVTVTCLKTKPHFFVFLALPPPALPSPHNCSWQLLPSLAWEPSLIPGRKDTSETNFDPLGCVTRLTGWILIYLSSLVHELS